MEPGAAHNGGPAPTRRSPPMPTLFRLLTVIAIIVGIVYGGMFALATYVEPNIGEMSVRIPPERINRQQP